MELLTTDPAAGLRAIAALIRADVGQPAIALVAADLMDAEADLRVHGFTDLSPYVIRLAVAYLTGEVAR